MTPHNINYLLLRYNGWDWWVNSHWLPGFHLICFHENPCWDSWFCNTSNPFGVHAREDICAHTIFSVLLFSPSRLFCGFLGGHNSPHKQWWQWEGVWSSGVRFWQRMMRRRIFLILQKEFLTDIGKKDNYFKIPNFTDISLLKLHLLILWASFHNFLLDEGSSVLLLVFGHSITLHPPLASFSNKTFLRPTCIYFINR